MPIDYIPRATKNFTAWLKKQHDNVAGHATALSASAAEITGYLSHIDPLLAKAQSILDLTEQLEQATADLGQLENIHLGDVRKFVKRGKTSPTYMPGIGEDLDWLNDNSQINPDDSRPILDIRVIPGRIIIEGRKPGFEAVNLYSRKKGETSWKLIAIRKRRFPIYDETPLTTPGVPEIREYQAWGIVADEQIGQPSEIKEIVFVG